MREKAFGEFSPAFKRTRSEVRGSTYPELGNSSSRNGGSANRQSAPGTARGQRGALTLPTAGSARSGGWAADGAHGVTRPTTAGLADAIFRFRVVWIFRGVAFLRWQGLSPNSEIAARATVVGSAQRADPTNCGVRAWSDRLLTFRRGIQALPDDVAEAAGDERFFQKVLPFAEDQAAPGDIAGIAAHVDDLQTRLPRD